MSTNGEKFELTVNRANMAAGTARVWTLKLPEQDNGILIAATIDINVPVRTVFSPAEGRCLPRAFLTGFGVVTPLNVAKGHYSIDPAPSEADYDDAV